jgi:hypothetical protein
VTDQVVDMGLRHTWSVQPAAIALCFATVMSSTPRRGHASRPRGGGDYAEPQYGPPVLSWFNSGLNGQGRPLAGLGRSPRGGFLTNA